MTAKKQNTHTDLDKLDAHIIQLDEYDDLPELTDEDMTRGTWSVNGVEVSEAEGRAAFRKQIRRGRPAMPQNERKVHQGLRLSPDVLGRFKATGPGWQTRIDEALSEWLSQHPTFGKA
jgi:uncharacterized protein (DUF4415 family)